MWLASNNTGFLLFFISLISFGLCLILIFKSFIDISK